MSETPVYQKNASAAYNERQKDKGLVRISFWIKPVWADTIKDFVKKLKKEHLENVKES